jgi:hypothetical protein
MEMQFKPNIAIYSDLQLEVNGVVCHLHSKDDRIILKFNSLLDAIKIIRNPSCNLANISELKKIDTFLNQTKMTLHLYRSWLAVAGFKKNILYFNLLKGILAFKK